MKKNNRPEIEIVKNVFRLLKRRRRKVFRAYSSQREILADSITYFQQYNDSTGQIVLMLFKAEEVIDGHRAPIWLHWMIDGRQEKRLEKWLREVRPENGEVFEHEEISGIKI